MLSACSTSCGTCPVPPELAKVGKRLGGSGAAAAAAAARAAQIEKDAPRLATLNASAEEAHAQHAQVAGARMHARASARAHACTARVGVAAGQHACMQVGMYSIVRNIDLTIEEALSKY